MTGTHTRATVREHLNLRVGAPEADLVEGVGLGEEALGLDKLKSYTGVRSRRFKRAAESAMQCALPCPGPPRAARKARSERPKLSTRVHVQHQREMRGGEGWGSLQERTEAGRRCGEKRPRAKSRAAARREQARGTPENKRRQEGKKARQGRRQGCTRRTQEREQQKSARAGTHRSSVSRTQRLLSLYHNIHRQPGIWRTIADLY